MLFLMDIWNFRNAWTWAFFFKLCVTSVNLEGRLCFRSNDRLSKPNSVFRSELDLCVLDAVLSCS